MQTFSSTSMEHRVLRDVCYVGANIGVYEGFQKDNHSPYGMFISMGNNVILRIHETSVSLFKDDEINLLNSIGFILSSKKVTLECWN